MVSSRQLKVGSFVVEGSLPFGLEISIIDYMRGTRLTVGRVEPYFDLHKLCARDAIMIPLRGWIWTSTLDWTPLAYSLRYMGLGWNI